MTPEYQEHLNFLRHVVRVSEEQTEIIEYTCQFHDSLGAVLKRLDDVEKALADTRTITCIWCGHKTVGEGRSSEELQELVKSHVIACTKRPERQLAEALYSISITLGLELWEDFPKGDLPAILEAVEKAMNAREMDAFLRGLRAGNVASGKDPDELPEAPVGAHEYREERYGPIMGVPEKSSCAVCCKPLSDPIHLSSTGQDVNGGIFDVIDKAVRVFCSDVYHGSGDFSSPAGAQRAAMTIGERIKLALQKASAEELQVRPLSSTGQPTRNSAVLESFTEYCRSYPEQRFWQALRNWSGQGAILSCSMHDLTKLPKGFHDTFQWEGIGMLSSTGEVPVTANANKPAFSGGIGSSRKFMCGSCKRWVTEFRSGHMHDIERCGQLLAGGER